MEVYETVYGEMLQGNAPDWQPLLAVAPELVDEFMWMFEVETEHGLRLHAYKHYWTRCYLHLDHEGRGFVYIDPDRYRRVNLSVLLHAVLSPWWKELDATPEQVAACEAVIERAARR